MNRKSPEQAEVTSDNTKDENSNSSVPCGENKRKSAREQIYLIRGYGKTDSGIKPSVRKKIEDIKADLKKRKSLLPKKEKAIQHKQPQQKNAKRKPERQRVNEHYTTTLPRAAVNMAAFRNV